MFGDQFVENNSYVDSANKHPTPYNPAMEEMSGYVGVPVSEEMNYIGEEYFNNQEASKYRDEGYQHFYENRKIGRVVDCDDGCALCPPRPPRRRPKSQICFIPIPL